MNDTLIVLGMAAITYGTRLVGLRLTHLDLPPFWTAFLRFVPISVFAALVVPSLTTPADETVVRTFAALVAGAVMWRARQLWPGIVVGMTLFWLLR